MSQNTVHDQTRNHDEFKTKTPVKLWWAKMANKKTETKPQKRTHPLHQQNLNVESNLLVVSNVLTTKYSSRLMQSAGITMKSMKFLILMNLLGLTNSLSMKKMKIRG